MYRKKNLLCFLYYVRYPQNLARNTGKQGCPTPFTMVPDTDMIPAHNMADKFEVSLLMLKK